MQCPKCKTNTLQPAILNNVIQCQTCKSCGGDWLTIPGLRLNNIKGANGAFNIVSFSN